MEIAQVSWRSIISTGATIKQHVDQCGTPTVHPKHVVLRNAIPYHTNAHRHQVEIILLLLVLRK